MSKKEFFEYDPEQRLYDAKIRSGAVLYRIASLNHWRREELLNGRGAATSASGGRFHRGYQRASYCGNNIFLCIAEKLFHMHWQLMETLADGSREVTGIYRHALSVCEQRVMLVAFAVKEVSDLVQVDSEAAKIEYDSRLGGSTLVCPLRVYKVLNSAAEKIRGDEKRGLMFPSARHSENHGYVFFRDETESIKRRPFEAVLLKLRLIQEHQDLTEEPAFLDPFRDRTNPVKGYFEALEWGKLEKLHEANLVFPELPEKGYIDFVRRNYVDYPSEAIRECRTGVKVH